MVRAIVAHPSQMDAPQLLFRKIQSAGTEIDILINNAGFAAGGYVR